MWQKQIHLSFVPLQHRELHSFPGGGGTKLVDNAALRNDVAALTTATSVPWKRCRGTVPIAASVTTGIGVGVWLACATAAFMALFVRERRKGNLQLSRESQYDSTTLGNWSTTQLNRLTAALRAATEPLRSEVMGTQGSRDTNWAVESMYIA